MTVENSPQTPEENIPMVTTLSSKTRERIDGNLIMVSLTAQVLNADKIAQSSELQKVREKIRIFKCKTLTPPIPEFFINDQSWTDKRRKYINELKKHIESFLNSNSSQIFYVDQMIHGSSYSAMKGLAGKNDQRPPKSILTHRFFLEALSEIKKDSPEVIKNIKFFNSVGKE